MQITHICAYWKIPGMLCCLFGTTKFNVKNAEILSYTAPLHELLVVTTHTRLRRVVRKGISGKAQFESRFYRKKLWLQLCRLQTTCPRNLSLSINFPVPRRGHKKTGIRRIWTLSLTHSYYPCSFHTNFWVSLAMPSVGVNAFCCFLLVCSLVFILHCYKYLLKCTCTDSCKQRYNEINLTAKNISLPL